MTARKTNLADPIYHDDNAARAHLEALLWPHGPVCPHCGVVDNATQLKGATTRPGVYKCREKLCRKPFSVTVGTVMERSKIALHKWVLAAHFMASSKKGMSALQLQRMMGLASYESAWFLFHRLREAATRPTNSGPMGGEGKTVEADETYVGGKVSNMHANKRPPQDVAKDRKHKVVVLVERDGEARSFHVANVTAKTLRTVLVTNVSRKSHLMTDGHPGYKGVGREFESHRWTDHSSGEYVRPGGIHSNTAESYFAILKRGVYGSFHSISEAHMHRYLSEFDFRYSTRKITDVERAELLLTGTQGKRLMYRQPDQASHA